MADQALPLGSLEEEADSEPQSPLSPVSPTIRSSIAKSSFTQASKIVVHRVNLQKFDEHVEANGVAKIITRRFSTPDAGAKVPGEVRRITSFSAAGADGDRPGSGGRPASGGRERSSSLALLERSSSKESRSGSKEERSSSKEERSSSKDETTTRALKPEEIVKRNKDAAAWFSNSKNINRQFRSIEDTEALLQKARDRREKGGHIIVRRQTLDLPLKDEPKQAQASSSSSGAAASSSAAPARRRTVDAAALWGPKPIKKKEPEAPLPEKKSCMRGNVQVGEQGANGLLARLRRRSTIN